MGQYGIDSCQENELDISNSFWDIHDFYVLSAETKSVNAETIAENFENV